MFTTYYKYLGVPTSIKSGCLRPAYLKLAERYRVDNAYKGMQYLKKVYNTLVNDEERQIYDKYGEARLSNIEDNFVEMVPKLCATYVDGYRHITYYMRVKLEEFYCGSLRKLYIQRKCMRCRGQSKDCECCQGVKKNDEIIVFIWMGTMPEKTYTFKLDSDGREPTIFTVKLIEVPHKIFKRDGHNLRMKVSIELVESLSGFYRVIEALDKRKVVLKKQNQTTKHNARCMVIEEGMPYFENGKYMTGYLIVNVRVKPAQLPIAVVDALRTALQSDDMQSNID